MHSKLYIAFLFIIISFPALAQNLNIEYNNTFEVNDTLRLQNVNIDGRLILNTGGVLEIINNGMVHVNGQMIIKGGEIRISDGSQIEYESQSTIIYKNPNRSIAGSEIPRNGIVSNLNISGDVEFQSNITVLNNLSLTDGTIILSDLYELTLPLTCTINYGGVNDAIDATVVRQFAQTDEVKFQLKNGSHVEIFTLLPLNANYASYKIKLNTSSINNRNFSDIDGIYSVDNSVSFEVTRLEGETEVLPKIHWSENDSYVDIHSTELNALGIISWDGNKWENQGSSDININERTVSAAYTTSLENTHFITLGYAESNETLNSKFLSFYAEVVHDKILLNWSFANENDNLTFHIEKSSDAIHFTEIGIIQCSSNRSNDLFQFHDQISENTAYYRIWVADNSQLRSYSQIINVSKKEIVQEIRYNSYSQNLQIINPEPEWVSIEFFDISGKKMGVFKTELVKGYNNIPCNISQNDLYIIRISGKETLKVIKAI